MASVMRMWTASPWTGTSDREWDHDVVPTQFIAHVSCNSDDMIEWCRGLWATLDENTAAHRPAVIVLILLHGDATFVRQQGQAAYALP
jgi:hypothetical protein